MRLRCVLWLLLVAACDEPGDAPNPSGCEFDNECGVDQLCNLGVCEACEVVLDLPVGNDPCLPKCGNELGVGMPCTKGGGQCNGNDIHALFCSIDQVEDAELALCTGPCGQDSDCGSASICSQDPDEPNGARGCIPASCE